MPSFETRRVEFHIIAGLLAAALAAWGIYGFHGALRHLNGYVYAEIIYDGQVVEKVYLDEERVFSVDRLPNVVFEVHNNEIAFIHSDCPDKVCVNAGRLSAGGDFAACLPNKVLLRIVDEQGKEPDTVVR